MTIDQVVAGAAALTSSASSFSASVPGQGETFVVASDAGYPSSGRFTVVLDRGLATEEKILISSRSGTTFTVETRGYDDTTAVSHSNPTVALRLPATIVTALIEHVDDIEADPHSTKLLSNTRHDTTTRHVFGSALGTPGLPTTTTTDVVSSAGSGSAPAREDHVHGFPLLTTSNFSTTVYAATGTIAGATPDDTANAGTSTLFARGDHRHAAPCAVAVATGTALAEGNSNSFSRANHVHTIGAGSINDAGMIADALITLAKIASEASTDYSGSVTFTNPSGNFVPGTGGTKYANYFKFGRIVVGWAGFTLGTSGNISGGSTEVEVSLPFEAAGHRGFAAARARHDNDNSTWSGTGIIVAGTSMAVNFATAGATAVWDGLTPFNWDDDDSFDCVFFYETAS